MVKGGRGKGEGVNLVKFDGLTMVTTVANNEATARCAARTRWRHDAAVALGTEEKHCSEGRKEEMLNVVDSI